MPQPFPKLYAIIDRTTLDARNLPVASFARELRDAGVRLLQYRDKHGSPQQILRACDEIRAAFAGSDATLILNDRADLASLAAWDGVHVGQGDLPVDAARRVTSGLVGLSTHTPGQLRAALAAIPDYLAIGPVFSTSTKPDAEPVVGLEGVRHARALTTQPLVAIGGITRDNARAVLDAGADSVAVIGGLFVPGLSIADSARDFLRILG